MMDPEIIKENYARLPDELLTALLKEEGTAVTYEAFILLKREYNKRKLDPAILKATEELRQEESRNKIVDNFKKEIWWQINYYQHAMLARKGRGETNQSIEKWLMKEGFEPEAASDAVKELSNDIRELYQRSRKSMLGLFGIILIGLISVSVFLSDWQNFTYAFIGGIMVISAIRYIPVAHRYYTISSKALEVIEREEEEQVRTGQPQKQEADVSRYM